MMASGCFHQLINMLWLYVVTLPHRNKGSTRQAHVTHKLCPVGCHFIDEVIWQILCLMLFLTIPYETLKYVTSVWKRSAVMKALWVWNQVQGPSSCTTTLAQGKPACS